ncbi:MAG TPA: DUF1376 domain-containing protein [Pyrinomonadaceae bacterium]|nr:DUF1376 domain-containing protein [Pyrinomonadaceae bacterium]
MKRPSFQWYPKDYLTSVRVTCMTLAEEGAYTRLLNYCWLHGSIPNDENAVARLIGKGATVQIARVCMAMFQPSQQDPTTLIHDRLEEEREKQDEHSETRRLAAEARWGKKRGTPADGRGKRAKSSGNSDAEQPQSTSNANAYANALQNTCSPSSSPSSSPNTEKDETNVSSKKRIGTRIPLPFELTEEMREYARTRAPAISVTNETEKFQNYWQAKSGKEATKLDWPATWRNWMLSAQERFNERNGTGGRPTGHRPTGSTGDFLARIGSKGTVI